MTNKLWGDELSPFSPYDVRPAAADEAAALFVTHAAIVPADVGHMMAWVQQLEERLEMGRRVWVMARGRRPAGYALLEPLPGLPGVWDLSGGIVPARQRQGLGTRLLARVIAAARDELGAAELSCRVDSLADETALFLSHRGFFVEHEECLLALSDLNYLPPVPTESAAAVVTYTRTRAIAEFCRLYDDSFANTRWAQPYTESEVDSLLANAEDLLFLEEGGRAVGVAWLELLDDRAARIEPIGIAREHQGQGRGRCLLLAALHELKRRRVGMVEIGLWRDNNPAMHLYTSLGFREMANWYYLGFKLTDGAEN